MSSNFDNRVPILSTAYSPPIEYFASFINSQTLLIECCENYQKQTYRNRCHILTANGLLPLIIPIVRSSSKYIKDIRIDNSSQWQLKHWRAIFSAYKSSPFFDYYDIYLESLYSRCYNFLFDFNTELLKEIIDLLNLGTQIEYSSSYIDNVSPSYVDLRSEFNPKKPSVYYKKDMIKYHQVFDHKFGFVSGLSIIDLLFNEGPMAYNYLESISKSN